MILAIATISSSCIKTGSPPVCKIVFPENGQTFTICDTINIKVLAEGTGQETNLIIDNNEVVIWQTESEFEYMWKTCDEDTGNHVITARVWDNYGEYAFDEVSIEIIK